MKEGRHFGRFAFLLLYASLSLMRRLRGPQKALILVIFWTFFGSQYVLKMVWKIEAKKVTKTKPKTAIAAPRLRCHHEGFHHPSMNPYD